MMRIFLLLLLTFFSFITSAQNTDIWLFQVESKQGKPVLNNGKNITARKGYDNQPSFSKDNKAIYYTSRGDSTQTDIWKYDIVTGKLSQVTFTSKTSEFSPSISPSGNLSVLMVEEDNAQRIWEFPIGGGLPKQLFSMHDSIGYYAWIDTSTVRAFMLGNKTDPPRLSVLSQNGSEKNIATNVGRGFTAGGIYTTVADSGFMLHVPNSWDGRPMKRVRTPGRSQDMALFGDYLLMGAGSELYFTKVLRMRKVFVASVKDFKVFHDLGTVGLKNITRIAVSADKKWIAIVAEDQ